MGQHHQINYIEMPSCDLEKTKAFFTEVFAWSFTDYGQDYCDFQQTGISGGFFRVDAAMAQNQGSALIVLYSDDLAASEAAIIAAGGEISQETFEFPGGRRFHFRDPTGNEFAVWTHN